MKKLLGLIIFLSLCFSQVLTAQTYEDGIGSYKAANTASLVKDTQGEQEKLEEAFKIFELLAKGAKGDNKSLIMYYLLSIKMKKPFSLEGMLFQYVKKEHKDFSLVEQIKFCGDDKILVLDKLKEIALQNEQQALKLLAEAKNDAQLEDYQSALANLQQVEKLWDINEVKMLQDKYLQEKQKKELKMILKNTRDLITRGMYKDALDTLNGKKGNLPAQEYNTLAAEIKMKWAESRLEEAKRKYNAKQYTDTIQLCDEANSIFPLNEAQVLKNKALKKMNKMNSTKPKAGFSLFGDIGAINKINLANTDFSWNGNSNQYAFVTNSNAIHTETVDDTYKKNIASSFGFVGMFSPSVGIMGSIGFVTQQWTAFTDYRFTWTWRYNNSTGSTTDSMTDNAKISLKPISLDLLAAMNLKGGTILKIYAGPTLFLSNIDFRTRLGYGGMWLYGNYVYAEWFPFEYFVKEKETLFGGNAGIDLEYKYSAFSSFYIGFQYFWLPAKTYQLQVIAQPYSGQLHGNLFVVGNPYNLANLPDYRIKLNLSFYRLFFGIRLYL
ncbi:MAG TPA: hypothetical protein VK469_07130 [Candidatus Kapabacteria bacterium]|nr:hypothetical protein [Candidatus Kapabacteria bacterium]